MMDDNEKIREQLSAYLDGELDETEAGRVEQALQAEKELAAELERLRGVRSLLRGLPTERAPKGFVETVLAQAERPRLVGGADRHPGNRAIQWVRYLATAAVLVVAVSVGAVVVATLWKASDFDYKPANGRPPIGPVAIAPPEDDVIPGSAKSDRGDAIARGKGWSRDSDQLDRSTFKDGRDVEGGIPKTDVMGVPTGSVAKAKDAYGAHAGEDIAGVQVVVNEDIFTSNIPAAAKEVELLFAANGLVLDRQVALTVNGTLMSQYSKKAAGRKAPVVVVQLTNTYQISNDTSEQRQWVVVAELAQAKRIVDGLKVVRANYDVGRIASRKRRREPRRLGGKAVEGLDAKALDEVREEFKPKGGRSTPGKGDKAESTVAVTGDIRQQAGDKLKSANEGAAPEWEDQAVRGLGGNGKIRAVETPGGSKGKAQKKVQKKAPVSAPALALAEKPVIAAARPTTSPARAGPKMFQRLVISLNFRVPVPAASRAATVEGKLAAKVKATTAPSTQPADANKAPVTATQTAPAK